MVRLIILSVLLFLTSYPRKRHRHDYRTRQDQVLCRNEAFAVQLEGMTNAYLA